MVSFKLPLGVFAVFLLSQNFAFIGIKNGKKKYIILVSLLTWMDLVSKP